ncbi:MAG: DUF3025 domain-containing protein [Rudaea sp.]
MRFIAPARDAIDPVVFDRPPLDDWADYRDLLADSDWPDIALLNARRDRSDRPLFVTQTRQLEVENLHYELRIAQRGEIATRERNWHDLLNAMIWLRFPELKSALNKRQVEEIAIAGPKTRTRAQYALTHFDEAGVIVIIRERRLLDAWDAHDWHRLFWRERDAWLNGNARVIVFGHALLEHALSPAQLLVGKAITVFEDDAAFQSAADISRRVAHEIETGSVLADPQAMRPLPLSGIPGWHAENTSETFYETAPCFRPLRPGRIYPPPLRSD